VLFTFRKSRKYSSFFIFPSYILTHQINKLIYSHIWGTIKETEKYLASLTVFTIEFIMLEAIREINSF
jgi:hypothetical protein